MTSGNVNTSLIDERIRRLKRLYKLEGKKVLLEQIEKLEKLRLELMNEGRNGQVWMAND